MSLEPGIYFGLPEEAYHADDALSASRIKLLRQSPSDFWWQSDMNPDRPEESESKFMAFGSALHKMVLEGQEVFDANYVVAPEKSDFRGLLVTTDDIKGALRDLDLKLSGKKAELIERLAEADPSALIWDDIWREHLAKCEAEQKTSITFDWYAQIAKSAAAILSNPHLKKAFAGGEPEVTVVWEDEGIRFKCRFDYLKVRAVVDLKSFSNPLRMPFDRALIRAVANNGYHIQMAHYLEGRSWIKQHWEEGHVFGDVNRDWLSKVAIEPHYAFVFVFYKTDGAPIAKGLQFNKGTILHGHARQQIAEAVATYRNNLEVFGTDMWVNTDEIWQVQDEEVPTWIQS